MCYNKGCGKQFDPQANTDGEGSVRSFDFHIARIDSNRLYLKHVDSCTFHSGVPVFHDALKGWSCCNKKSTDFSTFLSMPGCTIAKHSNVKPAEPEKPKEDPKQIAEVVVVAAPKPLEPMQRPCENEDLVVLPSTISPNLQTNLFRKQENAAEAGL
jgi:cysteine/histidine-rich domain-containing protein 1